MHRSNPRVGRGVEDHPRSRRRHPGGAVSRLPVRRAIARRGRVVPPGVGVQPDLAGDERDRRHLREAGRRDPAGRGPDRQPLVAAPSPRVSTRSSLRRSPSPRCYKHPGKKKSESTGHGPPMPIHGPGTGAALDRRESGCAQPPGHQAPAWQRASRWWARIRQPPVPRRHPAWVSVFGIRARTAGTGEARGSSTAPVSEPDRAPTGSGFRRAIRPGPGLRRSR